MKTKRILSACMALALAFTCCACSQQPEKSEPEPETAAQVLQKMQAALAETPCAEARMVTDMTMTLNGGETGTLEMSTRNTNELQISQNPLSGYTTATIDVDYGGEKSQSVTENYSVIENGELVSYFHSNGIWLKLSTGQTAEGLAQSASPAIEAATVALDKAVTEYDGRAAICLTSRITGDKLQTVLGGMLDNVTQQGGDLEQAAETLGAIDYAALSCDARIYLDKESYLPIAQEMTFGGMSEVLSPLYEQMGISVDVTGCTASAAFLSYETQEEIKLPEGAAEKADAWTRLLAGEPDNGDGSFTIREGAALIDIAPPEGFELTEKGYDHVCFKRDDHREIKYTAHYGNAEYFTNKLDRQLGRYGDLPRGISREQLPLESDTLHFTAEIVGVEWQSYEEGLIYAWADLGSDGTANYFIFIEITDGYNDGFGNSKSADVTPDEFLAYLNAATVSTLMD